MWHRLVSSAVGLLCASLLAGCAPLPIRGSFAKSANPEIGGNGRDLVLHESQPDGTRSGGGQFDVLSISPTSDRQEDIEAPPPIRRQSPTPTAESTVAVPREFVPASHAAPVSLDPNRTVLPPSRFDVTTADFQSAGDRSDVVPASGTQNPANNATVSNNPWNRFQDLAAVNSSGVDQRAIPAVTNPEPWPRMVRSTDSSPIPDSSGAGPLPKSGYNAQALPIGHSTGNQFAGSGNLEMGYGPMPMPAGGMPPFPAPAALPNFGGSQFSAPPRELLPLPAPVATLAPSPSSLASIAASADLERLLARTIVETAAMTPGDNETERQSYLKKHVQLRLLHLIAGQTDQSLQPIAGIDAADQEFWQQVMWGLANYFDAQGMPDSTERATQTMTQLQTAAFRLQEKARLELRHVAFCHKITSFGSFQRFKRDQFTPGQPVLLYAEVANFKSEPTDDGQFRTLMKSTIDVLSGGSQGQMIESIPFAPSEDRCRNHRRDYFHSYEFAIPQGIHPGPHVLQLTVEDQLGRKTASTRLNFTIE